MAEHPIVMDSKKQMKVFVSQPGQELKPSKQSVVSSAPKVSDPKASLGQKLSKYAFGEETSEPGKYIWKSYLEPTGKRVANDVLEYFLQMIKHTFQRWIWNGKILDDGKYDRTSYSRTSGNAGPVKAMIKMSPVKELTFDDKADAIKVLNELRATIENEGNQVTVRQYYEAAGRPELCEAGVSSSSGWTNLSKAEVCDAPDGDGFYIKLPKPISLTNS